MELQLQTMIALYAALILQLVFLTMAVIVDSYLRREQKKIFLIIYFVAFCLIAQNYADFRLDSIGTMPMARTIVGIVGYCIRPLILLLFLYIVDDKKAHWWVWILIVINTLVHLTALFSGVCFYISPDNHFHRGPLGFTCHVISGILIAYLVYLTVRMYRKVYRPVLWIPILNAVLIIAAVIVDSTVSTREYPASFLTIALVMGSGSYYLWLHLQFVHEHVQDLRTEQSIQLMMSQIQPHFIYNTLTTIQNLCLTDPDKAFDTIAMFGTYLRQNLESLDQPKLINFQKELEHTKVYAQIEMIRFPYIKVKYDIRDTDFELPALTVQPLVENAIRHGVRIRTEEGGIVTVITYREPRCHVIEIRDNGKGFDVSALEKADGKRHIGLRNVRDRLEQMCQGTMDIDSKPGEGTVIVIRLPVKEEKA